MFLIVVGSMLCAGAGYAQAADEPPQRRFGTDVNALKPIECGPGAEHLREPYFEFWEKDVTVPERVFLLIRKGGELGALRFTKLHLS